MPSASAGLSLPSTILPQIARVTGGYSYTFDARGRKTGWTMTLGSASYPFTYAYNDADQPTSVTYPDGSLLTSTFGAQDWLGGVTLTQGSQQTSLANALSYQGPGGATGKPTSAQIGPTALYTWNLTYDALARITQIQVQASGTTLFQQSRTFDAVGTVQTSVTTLPAGTDTQAFATTTATA